MLKLLNDLRKEMPKVHTNDKRIKNGVNRANGDIYTKIATVNHTKAKNMGYLKQLKLEAFRYLSEGWL